MKQLTTYTKSTYSNPNSFSSGLRIWTSSI